jgi:protein-L-isoaspartate(D-aspartate) O-methyltransferase
MSEDDPPSARAKREHLIDKVVGLAVRDRRVLDAMREIPRHRFVPGVDLERAYVDAPVPIGFEATISQPALVGIMSEALDLSGRERVLEIGTGSGYQAAVLSRLSAHVDTIEVVDALATRAREVLTHLGCRNVVVHTGDGWLGYPHGAPFDRIVVTAAPDVLPQTLIDQLADGGVLVVPVGAQSRDQRLERWRKRGATLIKQDLGAVRFVPMVHAS